MITTKTTGICDRCKAELDIKIHKLAISDINIQSAYPAHNFIPYYDGIQFKDYNFETDVYHLCDVCLKDFRQGFMQNEKTFSSPNS